MTYHQVGREISNIRIVVEDVGTVEAHVADQLPNIFSMAAYDGLDVLGHRYASEIAHIRHARDFISRTIKDPKNIVVTSRNFQDDVTGFAIARATSQDAFSLVAIGVHPDLRYTPLREDMPHPQIGAQLYHRIVKSISGQGGSRLDIITPSATEFFTKVGACCEATLDAEKYRFEDLQPYPEEIRKGLKIARYRHNIAAFRGQAVA
ncbi:MAG TPA: hypothetical protein VIN59_01375 [Alphaproteobacteria bacterium]